MNGMGIPPEILAARRQQYEQELADLRAERVRNGEPVPAWMATPVPLAGTPPPPPPPAAPEQRGVLGEQVLQTVLWLAANNAMLPAQALAGIGLDPDLQDRLADNYMRDLENLRLLQLASRSMTKPMVGRLLRGRLVGQALSAATAQEMAAVTRAFRSLPAWAWEEEEGERAEGTGDRGGAVGAAGQEPRGGVGAAAVPPESRQSPVVSSQSRQEGGRREAERCEKAQGTRQKGEVGSVGADSRQRAAEVQG